LKQDSSRQKKGPEVVRQMSHMESSKYGSTWTWIITALTEYINGLKINGTPQYDAQYVIIYGSSKNIESQQADKRFA